MSKSASLMTKISSITTLVILTITILFSYKQYEDYMTNMDSYKKIECGMKEELYLYIKGILRENVKKAEVLTEVNTTIIHRRLVEAYGNNLEGLENDLNDPNPDSQLNKILDEVLINTYVNNNTDSNKPIVATMRNIIWNRSIYLNSDEMLLWDNFINTHFNTILAGKAIEALKNMNNDKNDFIFWELNHNNLDSHLILSEMKIEKMLDVYYNEGLESLKGYELLVPVYITNTGDIFGTKDTNSIGEKINNYKIMVIQRVNVYDALIEYKSDLTYFNSEIKAIETEIIYSDKQRVSLLIQTIIFIICLLIGSAILQKKLNSN